ncbi:amino acid--tRNA ligase-related protein [Sphaerochaeta sp. UBA5836]|uniref:amino acid--tRNA ligase-related protein n=1 Tax=Sphaerochaeta sp. UBA5836 TaxID=1947474 RepID=UPI0025FF881D|nr:amino acid--tRNA ligase-related protein [Sphaerochaeta sp. UBA5836]
MKAAAQFRSAMYRTIRTFFDGRDYTEVDTPILSTSLIPESTIENFATRFQNPFLPSTELYLVPSPEIFMKQLIAQGWGSIYQISHCFRNSEQLGHIHNPEFSMLEYYTVGADEQDSIKITEELFSSLLTKDSPDYLRPPFARLSVAEAMKTYADVDLDKHQKQSSLASEARRLGLTVPDEPESWEETFNRIFLTFVEPNLPQDQPLVLQRYPKQIECLAKQEGAYRRRWELYVKGVEVANCYDEDRNLQTIQTYYRDEYARLVQKREESGSVIPDIDPQLAAVFSAMPACSGVALGLDRLQMLLMGKTDLQGVILFPLSGMLKSGNTCNL